MSTDSVDFSRRWRPPGVVGLFLLLLFQVGGTFGAAHGQPDATSPDALAVIIAAAGPMALFFARARPRLVLGFITTITFAYLALGYPYGPVFASFVGAAVINIALGYRIWAWGALAAMFVFSGFARLVLRDEALSWGWTAGVLAWVLVAVAVGELVRVRRANAIEAHRAREEQARRRASEERLQIARELHDVVAHHMSLINVQAGVALHLVDRHPDQVETALATIKDASKEALVELRSLIGVLRADGEAAPLSPVATLRSFDDLVTRTAQAGVDTRTRTTGDVTTVPAAVELAAYRIIQEALTNVVRHSEASSAQVDVKIGPNAVEVSIEDDGRGIGVSHTQIDGNGIRGMRERAHALGGTFEVIPRASTGTTVHAMLPFGDLP